MSIDLGGARLHTWIIGMLYPIVIGGVFFEYLFSDIVLFLKLSSQGEIIIYPRLVFGLIFLSHWSFSWAIYTESHAEQEYGYRDAISDGIMLGFMLLAFFSLPAKLSPGVISTILSEWTRYTIFYLSVGGLGSTFFLKNRPQLRKDVSRTTAESIDKCRTVVNAALVAWGLLFSIIHFVFPIPGSSFLVYIFIFVTAVFSFSVFRCRTNPSWIPQIN